MRPFPGRRRPEAERKRTTATGSLDVPRRFRKFLELWLGWAKVCSTVRQKTAGLFLRKDSSSFLADVGQHGTVDRMFGKTNTGATKTRRRPVSETVLRSLRWTVQYGRVGEAKKAENEVMGRRTDRRKKKGKSPRRRRPDEGAQQETRPECRTPRAAAACQRILLLRPRSKSSTSFIRSFIH